jgi:hypothetical protein
MGLRKSFVQEYSEDARGVYIRKIVKHHPLQRPCTGDNPDLPEEERYKPRTREEEHII